jgi:hypothetical protein
LEDLPHAFISPAGVMVPALPVCLNVYLVLSQVRPKLCYQGLTERELLLLHAEVKALQGRYGLSYKDAAHRLYHSEVQKLSMANRAYQEMKEIRNHADEKIVEEIERNIASIDAHSS